MNSEFKKIETDDPTPEQVKMSQAESQKNVHEEGQPTKFRHEISAPDSFKPNTPSLQGLLTRFKLSAWISFINIEDEADRLDFPVRKIDPYDVGSLSDGKTINAIAKILALQEKAELNPDSIEASDLVAVFDVDERVDAYRGHIAYSCAVASVCILDPIIPASQMINVLPPSFIKIIAEFCEGGITELPESVMGFRIQITYPKVA